MSHVAAQIALESIGQAIAALHTPTGKVTHTGGPIIGMSEDTYRAPGFDPWVRARLEADGTLETSPEELERLQILEALIGAAFTVAQTHLGAGGYTWEDAQNAPKTTRAHIWHVANYWKHRDTWENGWSSARAKTSTGIEHLLGQKPQGDPVAPGLLQEFASKALGAPFDTHRLWVAIG